MMPAVDSHFISPSSPSSSSSSSSAYEVVTNALSAINCLRDEEGGLMTNSTEISLSLAPPLSSREVYCPVIWDSLLCWDQVPAGFMAKVACSQVFQVMGVPTPTDNDFQDAFATRSCGSNGSWVMGNWTNYTQCLPFLESSESSSQSNLVPLFVGFILFFGSFLSIGFLLVSLFIFFHFKSLMCTRLRVHRNLFVALIIHSALLVIISGPVVMRQYFPLRYVDYSWLCKGVVAIKLYSSMASINWMFVEGLLLHTKLSGVFSEGPPFPCFYMIGWGLPAVIIIMWSSIMSVTLDTSCWSGYSKSPFIWILTVPMFCALIANAVFLVNIIRILVVKIKDTVSGEMRKALRATAFLFPLLGMNQLLFCVNPRDEDQLEDAYLLINSILQSSQGMLVAILYCFKNTQVKAVIKAAYCRHVMVRNVNNSTRLNDSRSKRSIRRPGETIL